MNVMNLGTYLLDLRTVGPPRTVALCMLLDEIGLILTIMPFLCCVNKSIFWPNILSCYMYLVLAIHKDIFEQTHAPF